MNIDIVKIFGWFVVLILAQVFVLNHIHLFGVATPLLYIYFVFLFRRNMPQWGSLLWAFIMGLIIDTFSNTPGVSSASLTLIAAVQPFVLRPFVPRDSAEDLQPGVNTLSYVQYLWYAATLTFIYNLVFFSLEMFSFFNILTWLECIGGSTLLTLLLILVIEHVRSRV
ncbi:rod shape-determining protein MreD [Prevotella ihumii]|uniref:rod shape-determining protein MreD n=1 Tax=Prevotella ihumii TaxID=1917878 RepID=UPI000980B397|nr:rod shape-determining protein MreD [Prevotella ihumii]